MKTTFHILMAMLIAVATSSLTAISPAVAQGACLSNTEIQNAINSGEILPLASALANAGVGTSQEVLSIKVCDEGGQWVYIVAVINQSGEAENLTLNAN